MFLAERRLPITARIVRWVTDPTEIIDALPIGPVTIRILCTGHTRTAIVTIDTNGVDLFIAPTISDKLTDLTGPSDTGRCLVWTIAVTETGHTLNTAGTKWRIPTAASVISHITDSAAASNALASASLVTIIVGHTADTHGAADTDGGVTTAACVIGHIAELTLLADTLLTGAIAITEAAHTARAVSCTHRRLSTTTRIIGRITDLALLGDTLATVTIAIALTTNTANTVAIVDANGRSPTATGVGAKDTELALIGHTLA